MQQRAAKQEVMIIFTKQTLEIEEDEESEGQVPSPKPQSLEINRTTVDSLQTGVELSMLQDDGINEPILALVMAEKDEDKFKQLMLDFDESSEFELDDDTVNKVIELGWFAWLPDWFKRKPKRRKPLRPRSPDSSSESEPDGPLPKQARLDGPMPAQFQDYRDNPKFKPVDSSANALLRSEGYEMKGQRKQLAAEETTRLMVLLGKSYQDLMEKSKSINKSRGKGETAQQEALMQTIKSSIKFSSIIMQLQGDSVNEASQIKRMNKPMTLPPKVSKLIKNARRWGKSSGLEEVKQETASLHSTKTLGGPC